MKHKEAQEKKKVHISAPDEISDYMRVTTPGVWLTLAGIVLLLAAALIWSVTGRIETKLHAEGTVSEEIAEFTLPASEIDRLSEGIPKIGSKEQSPEAYGELLTIEKADGDSYQLRAFLPGAPDGKTELTLVAEQIAPIRFLIP